MLIDIIGQFFTRKDRGECSRVCSILQRCFPFPISLRIVSPDAMKFWLRYLTDLAVVDLEENTELWHVDHVRELVFEPRGRNHGAFPRHQDIIKLFKFFSHGRLRRLCWYADRPSIENFQCISSISGLTHLSFMHDDYICDHHIELLSPLVNLTSLLMWWCRSITSQVLKLCKTMVFRRVPTIKIPRTTLQNCI